uniref:hypothetical protein n=1 Tax=uncultured Clostridium sp. TaxID=59620 RepID=UPI0026721D28
KYNQMGGGAVFQHHHSCCIVANMAIVFLLNPIFSAIFNSNHTKMMKALIIGYLSIEKLLY